MGKHGYKKWYLNTRLLVVGRPRGLQWVGFSSSSVHDCGRSVCYQGGRSGQFCVVRTWWRRIRTARALRTGVVGRRKCSQDKLVGLGKEASMMAAKRVRGRHSSSMWVGVGKHKMSVVDGVWRSLWMCGRRWGGGGSSLSSGK